MNADKRDYFDISKSDPESPNGMMHKLGFKKFHVMRANKTKRHFYERGSTVVELNSYDSAMEYANKLVKG
jgi:adenylate cyclase class IV